MASKMEDEVEDFIAEQLASIDTQITKIDNSKVVKAAEALLAQKTKLMATRRALLGGNAMTGGSSGTRITQQDVVHVLTEIESSGNRTGQAVSEIAEKLHTTEAVVRGHLNRGKDERFLKKNNLWYLRDPQAGINTAEDIEEDD